MKQEKPYFETLKDYVRLAGEEIKDRAVEIVPKNIERVSDLSIYIYFDPDFGSIPTIEWTMKVIPNMNRKNRLEEIKNIKTLADLNEKMDRDNGHF